MFALTKRLDNEPLNICLIRDGSFLCCGELVEHTCFKGGIVSFR